MPVTTLKRCQSDPNWWYTVEDCNTEVEEDPGTGIVIKYYDDHNPAGRLLLSVGLEDALMIRDAISQLYPPQS
jgi:formylmethanofuran dehydrogenase subunit A